MTYFDGDFGPVSFPMIPRLSGKILVTVPIGRIGGEGIVDWRGKGT